MSATIKSIKARQIIDSRGIPTIETRITLSDNNYVDASVPSGESLGKYESVELRDNDPKKFFGRSVYKAIDNVNNLIAPKLIGFDPTHQKEIDELMIKLDHSQNKSNLGANAILSVSEGVCRAAAFINQLPLYKYIANFFDKKIKLMPIMVLNLINGGKHGAGNLDFQEFHILPFAPSYSLALETGVEVYHCVKQVLIRHGAIHSVGDEGGFAPNLFTNLDALEILTEAIKNAEKVFGRDVFLGLDVAASHFFKDDKYSIRDRTMPMTTEELIEYYSDLNRQYPLYILEDPLNQDDWSGWTKLTALTKGSFIVGDDLLATNKERLERAIKEKACTAILVKPNQTGTISETFEVIEMAKRANWKIIVSHRSGETNDDFIADLAVGVGADFVKFGAPARGERVAKYNRILKIEEEVLNQ